MDPGFETALQAAVSKAGPSGAASAAPPPAERVALPLVTSSYEELMGRSAKELKQLLTERGLSTADCVEKGDLARKIVAECSKVTYYR
jgi:hypothetical protein